VRNLRSVSLWSYKTKIDPLAALLCGGLYSELAEVQLPFRTYGWYLFMKYGIYMYADNVCDQEASLADITYLFEQGALIDFQVEELVKLVRALFADSTLRTNTINKILNGHPTPS